MPIPPGARQVRGNPNRIQLANGDIVTRARARTLGAQLEGFKSESHRSKHRDTQTQNNKYFQGWTKSEQGKEAVKQARAQARSEGRPYRPTELKTEMIAARNDRKNLSGERWRAFAQKYGITGFRDWTRY